MAKDRRFLYLGTMEVLLEAGECREHDICEIEIKLHSDNEYSRPDDKKQKICALLKAVEHMLIGL